MSQPLSRLPFAGATLAFLGKGATADELERRFADAGVRLEPGVAAALLGELRALGLVRVARADGAHEIVVPTSLGTKALAEGIGRTAAVQLAELETLRTELLSTIAHELRTPLTAVRTSIGLLTDGTSSPSDEQRRTLLATIERNADRMQRVVGDILDLARFRSGSIRLQLRRFDAGELSTNAVASIGPLAVARSQTFVLDAPRDAPAVYGDRRRLEQALVNLVANAQRFSPDGAEIRIELLQDGGWVRWRVVDSGPGVSREDQARLFERFFVGRSDRHAARGGVGLGLPTALAIAQAHGGTIEVDSTVGRGSVFSLVVPIDGPPEAE